MPNARPFIDPARFWTGAEPIEQPFVLVDLDKDSAWPDQFRLPPCPVIGIGHRSSPHASLLDAVLEPPIGLDALSRSINAAPAAAELFVGLMRNLGANAYQVAQSLEMESLAYATLQAGAEHRTWLAGRDVKAGALAEGMVSVERTENCLQVTLQREANGNAIDRAMRDALHDAFRLAALDPQISRIVLRGAGRAFSLGADLAEFGTTPDPVIAHAIRRRTLPARALSEFKGLVDVFIQGGCVGAGLELAAFGTWVGASSNAWFQLPELSMGIIPGAGGCISVPRRIGRQRTALMVLSGRRISARTAFEWGLVDAIVDDPA